MLYILYNSNSKIGKNKRNIFKILFDAVKTLLSPSGQSIVNAANRLVQLGAKEASARKVALPKTDVGQQEELLNSLASEEKVNSDNSENSEKLTSSEDLYAIDSGSDEDPIFTITSSSSHQ